MATAIQRSIVQTYRAFGLTAFFSLKKYMTTKSLLTSIDESTLYSSAFFPARETKDLYYGIAFGSMVAVGRKALDHYNRFNRVFFQF